VRREWWVVSRELVNWCNSEWWVVNGELWVVNWWLSDFSFEKLYRSQVKTGHFIFKISKLIIQIFMKSTSRYNFLSKITRSDITYSSWVHHLNRFRITLSLVRNDKREPVAEWFFFWKIVSKPHLNVSSSDGFVAIDQSHCIENSTRPKAEISCESWVVN